MALEAALVVTNNDKLIPDAKIEKEKKIVGRLDKSQNCYYRLTCE